MFEGYTRRSRRREGTRCSQIRTEIKHKDATVGYRTSARLNLLRVCSEFIKVLYNELVSHPPVGSRFPTNSPDQKIRSTTSGFCIEQVYRSQSRPVYPAPFFAVSDPAMAHRRRKYLFTEQIDQLIQGAYLNQRNAKTGFGIRPLAKKVGIPYWALKKRARELGLARTKELPWSEPELAILARYAWMSYERIRLKLKAAGYSRTLTDIHLKLKRMKFKHDRTLYSAYSLAQALGIDPHVVTRWIKSGRLKAKFRGDSPHATAVRAQLPHPREGCPPFHP